MTRLSPGCIEIAVAAMGFVLTTIQAAHAEKMRFEAGGDDTRCFDCAWIQATGEITAETPAEFRAYFESGPDWIPRRVRFNSDGGDLMAALALGEYLREEGISTEIGSDTPVPDGHPMFGERASVRAAGRCASACAYAFLGGIERRIGPDSRIGFHRFYHEIALLRPSAELFTGEDLDANQRTLARIVLYVVKMGVDARIVPLASEAGADDMRWLSSDEASELRVVYEPRDWGPWRLETYKDGVLAISETNDKTKEMAAVCTAAAGPQVWLTVRNQDWDVAAWFEQVRTCPFDGTHPVFGARVGQDHVAVNPLGDGAASIGFQLPTDELPLTSPALLSRELPDYPSACSAVDFGGSTENFVPAVRMALKNCVE
jgi:hypothetical protein